MMERAREGGPLQQLSDIVAHRQQQMLGFT